MLNQVIVSDQMVSDAKALFCIYTNANVVSCWVEPNGDYDMHACHDVGVVETSRGKYLGEYNPDWCDAAKIFFIREEDGNMSVMFPN